jgi:hypothetical protein
MADELSIHLVARSAMLEKRAKKVKGASRSSAIRKVKIMISSRCNDFFPASSRQPLTDTRRVLKTRLEATKLFGQQLFEVWINEDAPPAAGDDGWEACMREVGACDVLVVLYNGNAGWTKTSGEIGICHGELSRGLTTAPSKVRLIQLGENADIQLPKGKANDAFREYVDKQGLFRAKAISTTELETVIDQTLLHAVTELIRLGLRESRKGKFHFGDALEWSKLDYPGRRTIIRDTLVTALVERGAKKISERRVHYTISKAKCLILVDAIPAAMSVSAARELVGRPFLRDHESIAVLRSAVGPIHILGCHRSITESQAIQLLGHPDAIVVNAPFGIYVADNTQKIQFIILANCRDATMTRIALQRCFDWLEQSGEAALLIERSQSRKRIIETIAKEK